MGELGAIMTPEEREWNEKFIKKYEKLFALLAEDD